LRSDWRDCGPGLRRSDQYKRAVRSRLIRMSPLLSTRREGLIDAALLEFRQLL
jgi:hypothetical protein